MTSIHFVVHPLPGTEDQLNDRYFIRARRKVEFKSKYMYGACYGLFGVAFTDGMDTVICVFFV